MFTWAGCFLTPSPVWVLVKQGSGDEATGPGTRSEGGHQSNQRLLGVEAGLGCVCVCVCVCTHAHVHSGLDSYLKAWEPTLSWGGQNRALTVGGNYSMGSHCPS